MHPNPSVRSPNEIDDTERDDVDDDDDDDDGLCDSPAPLKIDEGGAGEESSKEAPTPALAPLDPAWEEGERDEMAQLAERKLEEMKRQTLELQTKRMTADYQVSSAARSVTRSVPCLVTWPAFYLGIYDNMTY